MDHSEDASPYLYRLDPPTDDGPYQTEAALLHALQQVQEREPLHRYRVHVYEGAIDEAHYVGTDEAVVIWILKEVDLSRLDDRSPQEQDC